MNYKSFSNLNEDIIANSSLIPDQVDLIIGIPRSGILAASILATHTHLPLIDIGGFVNGLPAWFGNTKKHDNGSLVELLSNSQHAKFPLLFDDSIASGESMKAALSSIQVGGLEKNIITGAVYATPENTKKIDLYFEKLQMPRIFEWNLFHNDILKKSCFDIDGVLCRDPSESENDDGPEYIEFLNTVPAWHCPSVEIGWIVTSRLEKYRRETENWLKKNNIRYKKLLMLDMNSAEERRKLGIHASFKAGIYRKVGAKVFVESSFKQTLEIAKISKKCVLCYENGKLVWPEGINGAWARQQSFFDWKQYIPSPLKIMYNILQEKYGNTTNK